MRGSHGRRAGPAIPVEQGDNESSLDRRYVTFSNHRSSCPWKGQAHYFSLLVNGEMNPDAVWTYPDPSEAAAQIKGRVAFWKGVQVTE